MGPQPRDRGNKETADQDGIVRTGEEVPLPYASHDNVLFPEMQLPVELMKHFFTEYQHKMLTLLLLMISMLLMLLMIGR